MRVNLTIFLMIVVDTWLVYSQATGSTELQSEFYVLLAEELIDNNIDSRPQHWRNSGEDGTDRNDESAVMTRTGRVRAGVSCHLTPTKHRCCTSDGELTGQRLQGCLSSVVRKQLTFVLLAWIMMMSQKHHGCVTLKNNQHASPTTISTHI